MNKFTKFPASRRAERGEGNNVPDSVICSGLLILLGPNIQCIFQILIWFWHWNLFIWFSIANVIPVTLLDFSPIFRVQLLKFFNELFRGKPFL